MSEIISYRSAGCEGDSCPVCAQCDAALYPERRINQQWLVTVDENRMFRHIINESLYENYARRNDQRGDIAVMMDDDFLMFHRFYLAALADLQMAFMANMENGGGCETDENGVTSFYLRMTANHNPQTLPALGNHVFEFVVKRTMEMWYRQPFGSETEMNEIRHVLSYRRERIHRKISSIL